jgi:hypothetical protein
LRRRRLCFAKHRRSDQEKRKHWRARRCLPNRICLILTIRVTEVPRHDGDAGDGVADYGDPAADHRRRAAGACRRVVAAGGAEIAAGIGCPLWP